MTTNALNANRYGMALGEYEGGNTMAYLDTLGNLNVQSGAASNINVWDMIVNWQYDAGQVGSTYNPAYLEQLHWNVSASLGVQFPSQFLDGQEGPSPFNFTRYFGDSTSATAALFTKNAAGPCGGCTTYPAPTFTVNYAGDTTNRQSFAGGCSSCTDTLTGLNLGTAAGDVFLLATLSGGTFSATVTCDTQAGGTPVVMTLDNSSTASGGFAGIFHGHLSANASPTRSCTVAYSGTGASSRTRVYYAMTVTGLTSPTPDFLMPTTYNTQNGVFTAHTNSLVVYSANSCAYAPIMSGSTTPSLSKPATSTLATSFNTSTAFAMWNPSFNSVIDNANCAGFSSGSATAAVYH
jgi:hypothetical protein